MTCKKCGVCAVRNARSIRGSLILVLAFVCVVGACLFLFAPWMTVPVAAQQDVPPAYTIFAIGNAVRAADAAAADVTLDAARLTPQAPLLFALGVVVLVSLAVFVVLLLRRHRRCTLFAGLGFGGLFLLGILFLNMVFDANTNSAYFGPGLFTEFLRISPASYLSLLFAFFCCVVTLPLVSDVVSGQLARREQERREKRALQVQVARQVRPGEGLRRLGYDMLRDKYLYMMLVPVVAYYLVFYYLPYRGLQIAFMDYKPLLGYAGSKWVGLTTFQKFFTGPYFWRLLRNTVTLSVYRLLWGFPIPIILAILFNELWSKRFRTAAQTLAYIPHFISAVVVAGMVVNFLSPSSGIVNVMLGWFGVEPIHFITKTSYFRSIFIIQGIWTSAGYGSIIYYSSICSIDAELYEAARIDGAGRFRQTLSITLPSLIPTIAIMLILEAGNLLRDANTEMMLLLYRPATYDVSDIIGTYVYRMGMVNANPNYSLGTAVGLFNGVAAFIMATSANKISRRMSGTSIY